MGSILDFVPLAHELLLGQTNHTKSHLDMMIVPPHCFVTPFVAKKWGQILNCASSSFNRFTRRLPVVSGECGEERLG